MTEHSPNSERPANQRDGQRGARRRRRNRRRVERTVTNTAQIAGSSTAESLAGPSTADNPAGSQASSPTSSPASSLHDATLPQQRTSPTVREGDERNQTLDQPDQATQPEQRERGKQEQNALRGQATEPEQRDRGKREQNAPKQHAQFSSPEVAPYVFVAIQTNGIHPSTARLLSLGVSTADAEGNIVDTWHVVVDPKEDPGPQHLHGLTSQDFEGAPQFGIILSKLAYALDGRTLVTHDAPRVWGFIIAEAKRARRQANRENRKNRGRRRHGRARVGRIPAPTMIVDTLATARRQGTPLPDTRLRGVARAYGLDVPSPVASLAGREVPEHERTLHDVTTTLQLFAAQGGFEAEQLGANALGADDAGVPGAGVHDATGTSVANAGVRKAEQLGANTIAAISPEDLKADSVGLQRSAVRVAAIEAPRPVENPGAYQRGRNLQEGMEFAVAPEVVIDPDELISAGVGAGLVYSEKVTRKTSLLVCNQPADVTPEQLVGKAMHAHRKEIPLVSDEAFLRLVESAK